MSYKNHKDQKLLVEAYKSVKQNNKVVVENTLMDYMRDPTLGGAALASAAAAGTYKLGKMAFKGARNWLAGLSEKSRPIFNDMVAKFERQHGKNYNITGFELLDFLYDKNYLSDYVSTIINHYKNGSTEIREMYGQGDNSNFNNKKAIQAMFKKIADEKSKNFELGRNSTRDLLNIINKKNKPAPTPGPAPAPAGGNPPGGNNGGSYREFSGL
jgi:hypothetical protein